MQKMRLEYKLVRTLLKDSLYYPGRLAATSFTIFVRYGLSLGLYAYVFRLNNGIIHNLTFPVAAWSMFFYFTFYVLCLHGIAEAMMQDVRSGNVETLFSKPISYLSYRMWWQIGTGLYPFLFSTVTGAIILGLTVGVPSTAMTPSFAVTFLLTMFLCILLTLFLYGIVGLLAFWIEDIMPVGWFVNKAIMIFGGSYVPVAFFSPFMYKFARYSPFGASQFITHTVYESWHVDWYWCIGIQIFWLLTCALIAYLLLKRARKKMNINGG